METLTYLSLVTADESPDNLQLTTNTFDQTWVKVFHGKKLPSAAWIHLGAIALAFTLIGTASQSAFALQIGNRGSEITTLQQNLTTAGFYKGPITGFYGELTQSAVRRFQQAKGLAVDGIAGSDTLSALNGTSGSRLPTGILLQRGSRGTAVTQLQKTLTAKGFFKGPVTGYYGELTQSAVRRFQQSAGLAVDGIAGSRTLSALNGTPIDGSSVPTGTQLQLGNSGTAVSQLQNRLRDLGFYKGPITGFYGRLTEAAVRDFQSSRRISVNGIAGPTTLAALQGNSSSSLTTATLLQRGSKGSAVTQLQNQLRMAGVYNGPVTGFYGELTEAAVRRFQSSRGISVNGIAGPTTLAALLGNSSSRSAIAFAPQGSI